MWQHLKTFNVSQ
jgi:hypothetical protein